MDIGLLEQFRNFNRFKSELHHFDHSLAGRAGEFMVRIPFLFHPGRVPAYSAQWRPAIIVIVHFLPSFLDAPYTGQDHRLPVILTISRHRPGY